MSSWGRAILLGVLAWLIPFVVSFLAFPLHESARPLFESIMAVTVAASAVIVGLRYLQRTPSLRVGEATAVGVLWLVICILIDAPLMLIAGPMRMSVGGYLADIGLTYVTIPVITWGLGTAWVAGSARRAETVAS